MSHKRILDVTCGSRMMWFDKQNKDALYLDRREEIHVLCDGRELQIKPDVIADFTKLPFKNNSFYLVVFDPPHLKRLGQRSWMSKKYGVLFSNWEIEIKEGFEECMRVLKKNGTLIFKWNESQIPTSKIIEVIGHKPLFGHTSGKGNKTIWMTFMK